MSVHQPLLASAPMPQTGNPLQQHTPALTLPPGFSHLSLSDFLQACASDFDIYVDALDFLVSYLDTHFAHNPAAHTHAQMMRVLASDSPSTGESQTQVSNATATSAASAPIAGSQPRAQPQQVSRRQVRFEPYTPPLARSSRVQQPVRDAAARRKPLGPITNHQPPQQYHPRRQTPQHTAPLAEQTVSRITEPLATPMQSRAHRPSNAARAPQKENVRPAGVKSQTQRRQRR